MARMEVANKPWLKSLLPDCLLLLYRRGSRRHHIPLCWGAFRHRLPLSLPFRWGSSQHRLPVHISSSRPPVDSCSQCSCSGGPPDSFFPSAPIAVHPASRGVPSGPQEGSHRGHRMGPIGATGWVPSRPQDGSYRGHRRGPIGASGGVPSRPQDGSHQGHRSGPIGVSAALLPVVQSFSAVARCQQRQRARGDWVHSRCLSDFIDQVHSVQMVQPHRR